MKKWVRWKKVWWLHGKYLFCFVGDDVFPNWKLKKRKTANFLSQGKHSAVCISMSFEGVPILKSPNVEVIFSNGKQPHSVSISLPLSPCVNSSPALFSLILCLAFKQSWNVRRPLSILIKINYNGRAEAERERERDDSIEGIKLHLFRV